MRDFSIIDLLEKLEQIKLKSGDLLTIEEISYLDEAMERLRSYSQSENQSSYEDLVFIIKLLLDFFTICDNINNS